MQIKPIRNDKDYRLALAEIEKLMDAPVSLAQEEQLDLLATLVEGYEAKHHPIDLPDPIEAILFMMEQKGLTRQDLEPAIGSRGRVAEILNRRRPLTLPMIRRLVALLELPADVLVQPYPTQKAA
jgi:HTH-type transcriptional regulator/antitoxin HigA